MSRLCTQTHNLLINRPRTKTLEVIERDTGLKKEWLASFVANRVDDPGVKKIERLYVYLSGRELDV